MIKVSSPSLGIFYCYLEAILSYWVSQHGLKVLTYDTPPANGTLEQFCRTNHDPNFSKQSTATNPMYLVQSLQTVLRNMADCKNILYIITSSSSTITKLEGKGEPFPGETFVCSFYQSSSWPRITKDIKVKER